MSRFDRLLLHLSVALTTITGAAFAIMRYGMSSPDPFAVANHPLQPYALAAHVVVSPVALFFIGVIFRSHIWRKYRTVSAARRRSGIGAMLLIAPMTLSAYLLQVSSDERVRTLMAGLHWVASSAFVIAYLGHQVTPRKH